MSRRKIQAPFGQCLHIVFGVPEGTIPTHRGQTILLAGYSDSDAGADKGSNRAPDTGA